MLAAEAYWTASRCRLNRWYGALRMFEDDLLQEDDSHNPWPAIEIVVQEILVSELLTRVWSATMIAHDHLNESDELSGLAHGIHVGHIEAKNRAIRLILRGRDEAEETFNRMNHLRRRVERWTDLFLSLLPLSEATDMFAFDASRMQDFALENREYSTADRATKLQILTASLAADLANATQPFPANPDLNRQVAAGVLSCFPSDRFDSVGLPKSAQMVWLEKGHLDSELLLNHLARLEATVDYEESAVGRYRC